MLELFYVGIQITWQWSSLPVSTWPECYLKCVLKTDLLLGWKTPNNSVAFTGKNLWCPEKKMELLMESEDNHTDHILGVGSTDVSENSCGGEQLLTNVEER